MRQLRQKPTGALRSTLQRLVQHLPLVVLGLSIVVNVLLASRLLHAQRASTRSSLVGTTVGPFQATSPSGTPILVDYEHARGTILYHFNPACGWCERNWENVRTLIHETNGRYRFVGVSTTNISETFMRDHGLDFEVAGNVSDETARQYGLAGTPQTMVISPQGRVVKSWAGAYVGTQAKDIGAYFSVAFPGLLPGRSISHTP